MIAISNKELLINEEIKGKEVRVIDSDGSQLGIITVKEAQDIAISKNLDLVNIAPLANPPVCKIMDYGKYRFEISKKEKEAKKNQKIVDIKELRLSVNIYVNDFNTKVEHAKKFLKAGNRVKVAIRFRKREIMHTQLGDSLMSKFAESCSEFGIVEKQPKMEGRSMIMYIASKLSK